MIKNYKTKEMEGLLFCKYCKIHVTGDRKRCPLCQNPLYGEPDPDSSLFPNVSPKAWKIQKLILHSFLFVSFAVVVICLTVDALLPESHSYPWYVAGAVLCMWFCLGNALYRRHNIPKKNSKRRNRRKLWNTRCKTCRSSKRNIK